MAKIRITRDNHGHFKVAVTRSAGKAIVGRATARGVAPADVGDATEILLRKVGNPGDKDANVLDREGKGGIA